MMKRTREEKKAELRALAEEVIEGLGDWEEENEEPTLTQIEDIVLKLRNRLGKRMAEMIIEEPGREQGRGAGDGARILLLSEVREGDFPPWTGNWG